MSYILEALKKSDQERQSGKGPSLQTVHTPARFSAQSSEMKWIIVILLCMLAAMLVFISMPFWLAEEQPATDNIALVAQSETAKPPAQPQKAVESIETVPILNSAALRFVDLDANTRSEIPSMTFSFHVYSDNPEKRTIIINNRRVREAELVEKGLLLEEITDTGVVFVWQNRVRFSIDVVEAW